MAKLNDYFESDMNLFLNLDDFGSLHTIDGRQLSVVLDTDQLMKRIRREYDGLSVGEILYFVKASDYGERPEQGAVQVFDGKIMYVFNCKEDHGMYEIILQQNRGE